MTTEKVTYMGRRFNSKNRLLHFYQAADGESTYGWRGPLVFAQKVGAIIELTHTPTGTFYSAGEHGPKIIGYMEDQVKRGDWEALSLANGVIYNQRQREKKINRDNPTPVEQAVKLLQFYLTDLPRAEKKAFIAHLLGELL